jgi:hypothetical protein
MTFPYTPQHTTPQYTTPQYTTTHTYIHTHTHTHIHTHVQVLDELGVGMGDLVPEAPENAVAQQQAAPPQAEDAEMKEMQARLENLNR